MKKSIEKRLIKAFKEEVVSEGYFVTSETMLKNEAFTINRMLDVNVNRHVFAFKINEKSLDNILKANNMNGWFFSPFMLKTEDAIVNLLFKYVYHEDVYMGETALLEEELALLTGKEKEEFMDEFKKEYKDVETDVVEMYKVMVTLLSMRYSELKEVLESN